MRLFRFFLASFFLAVVAPDSMAQGGGRVAVRVVGERLIIACDLSSPSRRIPVNLFLDLDTVCGLQLHNKAASPLGAETQDGQPIPLTLHFPDFRITVPQREHGDEQILDDFTKYYSAQMGEDAVVGTLGAEVLQNYHLIFDLANGYVDIQAKHERQEEIPTPTPGSVTVQITEENQLLWLPARQSDGTQMAMALGGSRFDSTIDQDLAYAMGAPAGDIGSLKVGDIDLSKFVAFRPEEVILTHPDRAVGVLGINFFLHYRIEIDRENRWARFTATEPASFPEDDLQFFRARSDEDADALETFLTAWPEARLGSEAARMLLHWRIDDAGSKDEVQRALNFADHFQQEDLRATGALDLMKELGEDAWPDYQIMAGELGLLSARDDRYPDAVHKIHSKLGEIHLAKDHGEEAWRHLLSAAFGLPEDGMINLNLGRYYEQQGRWRRAFSRFIQASIVPESGTQAVEGLMRVQPFLPDGEPFSVELVERMIQGKVLNFGASASYEALPEHAEGKVALIEFFTNGSLKGAEAGALGNEGLLSHFKDGPAAFLSYHMDQPGLDPMTSHFALEMARIRKVDKPTVHVIDGYAFGPGAGRTRDREAIFSALRRQTYEALKFEAPWSLAVEDFYVEGGVVKGKVILKGDSVKTGRKLCIVLAERGVLYPGPSKVVIHRMVARAALTDAVDGVEVDLRDGQMEVSFSQSLAEVGNQNEAWLDKQMAAGLGQTVKISMAIDPEQVSVVAYVFHPVTGRVEQAFQIHNQVESEL